MPDDATDDAVLSLEGAGTKRYQVIKATPDEEDQYQEEKSERWAVQSFCEWLGDYLTAPTLEPGTTFFVRRGDPDPLRTMRNAPRDDVIISYTIKER